MVYLISAYGSFLFYFLIKSPLVSFYSFFNTFFESMCSLMGVENGSGTFTKQCLYPNQKKSDSK